MHKKKAPNRKHPRSNQHRGGRRVSRVSSGSQQLEVIYEDQDLIIINKPAGLLSVPIEGSTAINALALVNRVLEQRGEHAAVVHRIDRYTSGVIVFAKNADARHRLVQQFLRHTPQRIYLAVVRGWVKADQGTLSHAMILGKRSFAQQIVRQGTPGSSVARLTYHVLERFGTSSESGHSLVEVALDTGLKNQIRAQFAAIGHPLVGDRQYGADQARRHSWRESDPSLQTEATLDRQALHAVAITIVHPRSSEELTCEAALADDMRGLLNRLCSPGDRKRGAREIKKGAATPRPVRRRMRE